jgi:hypothetical protein
MKCRPTIVTANTPITLQFEKQRLPENSGSRILTTDY